MRVRDDQAALKLLSIQKLCFGIEVRASIPQQTARVVIHGVNTPYDVNATEWLQQDPRLAIAYGGGDAPIEGKAAAARIARVRTLGHSMSVQIDIYTLNGRRPDSVTVTGGRKKAHPYIEHVTRCGKCHSFKHRTKQCRANVHVCGNCAGEHHHNNCKKHTLWCVHCKTTDHGSSDSLCPRYLERRQVERLVANEGMSRSEAWAKVTPRNADAKPVSSQSTPSESTKTVVNIETDTNRDTAVLQSQTVERREVEETILQETERNPPQHPTSNTERRPQPLPREIITEKTSEQDLGALMTIFKSMEKEIKEMKVTISELAKELSDIKKDRKC